LGYDYYRILIYGNPTLEVEITGHRGRKAIGSGRSGNKAVTGAAAEAFARCSHCHRNSLLCMCRYSLTQIAVDWGVYAADRLYYDVLFIGTGQSVTLLLESVHAVSQVLPKVIWEECVALAQLRNKVSIDYNGTPNIYPQSELPLPLRRLPPHPHLMHPSLDRPHSTTPNSIRNSDPISRLATILFPNRSTNRPTDRQMG